MNNDLEQFSEERLKEIAMDAYEADFSCDEIEALARIALAAKQAKPMAYTDNLSLETLQGNGMACMWKEGNGAEWREQIPLYTTPQPAHTEQVIPEGWKLVPIQPTEEMINAWDEDMGQSYARVHAEQIGEDELVFAYQAMLAAAPKPESE